VGVYLGLAAEIVSTLDLDQLADYCLLIGQVAELDRLRAATLASWERMAQEGKAEQAGELLDLILKIDARSDRKRSLLNQLRQSLYLTPRSRAGTAPKPKPAEPELDDLEKYLLSIESEGGNHNEG
jgi:hypothetical protein